MGADTTSMDETPPPPRRRWRWLKWLGGTLLVLVLVVAAGVWWLVTRPDGVQRAVALADGLGGVRITATNAQGPLAGPFSIDVLTIEQRRVSLRIEGIAARPRIAALWHGTVAVDSLHLKRVTLTPHDAPPSTAPVGFLPAWLRITFDDVKVDEVVIANPRPVLTLRGVSATGSLSRWRLSLARLAADGGAWQVQGKADLLAKDPLEVEGEVRATVRVGVDAAGRTRHLVTDVRAEGPLTALRFAATGVAPAGLTATGVVNITPPRVTLIADAVARRANLAVLGAGALGAVDAKLKVTGTLAPAIAFVVRGPFSATALPADTVGTLGLDLQFGVTPQVLTLQSATVTTQGGGTVMGDGTIALQPAVALDLRGTWQDLGWPFTARKPQVALPKGEWTARGLQPLAYTGQGLARLASAATPGAKAAPPLEADVAASGTVDGERLVLERFTAQARGGLRGRAEGQGEIGFAAARGGLPWRVAASGTGLDLRTLAPRAPRALDFSLRGTGEGFDLPRPGGSGQWSIDAARVVAGRTRLEARGKLGRVTDFRANASVPDLGTWLEGYGGAIEGSGRISADQRGTIDVQATNLRIAGLPDGLVMRRAVLAVNGSLADHATKLEVTTRDPVLTLALAGQGQWPKSGDLYTFALQDLALTTPGEVLAGERKLPTPLAARLVAPATLKAALSGQRAEWTRLCLAQGEAAARQELCTAGTWQAGGPWAATLTGQALDLAPWLSPVLGPLLATTDGGLALAARGRVDVQAEAAQRVAGGPLTGRADLALRNGVIAWSREDADGELRLGTGTLTAALDGAALSASTHLEAQGGLLVDARVNATRSAQPWAAWPLAGQVNAQLPALDFIPALVPDIDRVAGRLTADAQLAGTLGLPEVRGTLVLADGEMDVVQANLKLRGIQARAALTPGELALDGQATAGKGSLSTRGRLQFGPKEAGGTRGLITLQGKDLLLADVPEARIVASPDLTFTLADNRLQVGGTVNIPSAHLAPLDLTGAVLPSSDERLVGSRPPSGDGLRVDTRVKLVLGDDVKLDTFGLTGRLTGSLTAVAPPEGTATGSGELSVVSGKYKAYTRELDIERGRLLFTGGPLADPGLDLRASRQFPGVKAGVLVRGTLARPLVRFFSDPPLSQNQIASLLVVGRTLDSLQDPTTAGGTSTRDSLVQQGGAMLAGQLGQYVGIDEVQLERGTNDAAALVLGKYLSPRLYVSYGVSLTEALNTLKLRYTLGERWVIKTEAGSRQSVDVEYTLDR